MFSQSAAFYDDIYAAGGKDYAAEAAAVAEVILARNPGAETLLDVACGTGGHLEFLATRFTCAGVDADPGMLAVARARLPGVPLAVADMVDLALGEQFDALTCLFSSIGYVETPPRLAAAVSAMAGHLRPGGVLVVEPWLQPDIWEPGHFSTVSIERPGLKVCRLMQSSSDGPVSVLDATYLVTEDGHLRFLREQHRLGLFAWDRYAAAFAAADLRTEVDRTGPTGRGLIIGTRPGRSGPDPALRERPAAAGSAPSSSEVTVRRDLWHFPGGFRGRTMAEELGLP